MRRFNFTDRKKLATSSMKISLSNETTESLKVDVDLDFSGFTQPATSQLGLRIMLDAHGRVKFQRHELGSLGQRLIRAGIHFNLFARSEIANFRIKIVDNSSKKGRIVAISRPLHLRTQKPEQQQSFLPVRVDELDEVVFKVEFVDQCPTLVLNRNLDSSLPGGIKNFAVHPAFVSLVLPEVVRQVLVRYLFVEARAVDDLGHDDAFSDWMRFSLALVPDYPEEGQLSEDPNEIYAWIDQVASRAAYVNFTAIQKFQDLTERLK
jgi:hypothetical protein